MQAAAPRSARDVIALSHRPHEHRPAGRPTKVTPLYETLASLNAEFAVVNGWERADYFKPSPDFEEVLSFRFNNTFDVVAAEVKAVQETVGIMEVSGFNRYELSGEGVHDWLDGVMCSRIPHTAGKVGLAIFSMSWATSKTRRRSPT